MFPGFVSPKAQPCGKPDSVRSGRQAPRVCRTRQPRARADGRETLSQRYDEHNDTFRSYHPPPPSFHPSFLPSASTARRGLAAMPFLRQAHFLQWGIAGKWPNHRFRATHSFCTPDSSDQAMECIKDSAPVFEAEKNSFSSTGKCWTEPLGKSCCTHLRCVMVQIFLLPFLSCSLSSADDNLG